MWSEDKNLRGPDWKQSYFGQIQRLWLPCQKFFCLLKCWLRLFCPVWYEDFQTAFHPSVFQRIQLFLYYLLLQNQLEILSSIGYSRRRRWVAVHGITGHRHLRAFSHSSSIVKLSACAHWTRDLGKDKASSTHDDYARKGVKKYRMLPCSWVLLDLLFK